MRKKPSKRRWIARFYMGRDIPWKVMEEFPGLKQRLRPFTHLPDRDAVFIEWHPGRSPYGNRKRT